MSTAANLFRSPHLPKEDSPLRLAVPGDRFDFVKLNCKREKWGSGRIRIRAGTECYAFRTHWLDKKDRVRVQFKKREGSAKAVMRVTEIQKDCFEYEQTITPSIDSPIPVISNYAKGRELQKLLKGNRLCFARGKSLRLSSKTIEMVIHKASLRNPFQVEVLYGNPDDEEGLIDIPLSIDLLEWGTVRRFDKEELLTVNNERLRRFGSSSEECARIKASYELVQVWEKKREKLIEKAQNLECQFVKEIGELDKLANETLSDEYVKHQLLELCKKTKLWDNIMQLRNLHWTDQDQISTTIRSLAWIRRKTIVEEKEESED